MNRLEIRLANWHSDRPAIESIRRQVFHLEQGVATELDFDGADAAATQILAYYDSQPVATARIRYLAHDLHGLTDRNFDSAPIAKIERLAVLAAYRKRGIGSQLMEFALQVISDRGVQQVKINAQTYVAKMYRQLGFESQGKEFHEAGIAHITMYKYL
jgi:predicted GNAT family N-acyltransferase